MSYAKKYSKDFSFYLNTKKDFFDKNDELLGKAHKKNSAYSSQIERNSCKLCEAKLQKDNDFSSHNVGYVFCRECGHLNGRYEDTKQFIEKLYISEAGNDYAVNYLDPEYKTRTTDIYIPKVDFLVSSLPAEPFTVLDIGCGAGYFVAACGLRNIEAKGVDVSVSMTEFGNSQIEKLTGRKEKYLTATDEESFYEEVINTDADVVSVIGVIEHLRKPRMFFEAFQKSNAKYLFYSVPMYSLSVLIEHAHQDVFPRHLAGAHTHLFTESSIKEMNFIIGAEPIAEWRFGTDVMDLYRSLVTRLNKGNASEYLLEQASQSMIELVEPLQAVLDQNHFCSEIHSVLKKS